VHTPEYSRNNIVIRILRYGMATFHPFPRLPAELRAQIWQMTVEPRIVGVCFKTKRELGRRPFSVLTSSTYVPAPLQTCQEARNARLYQRCFSDLAIRYGYPEDAERRYVWINLDIDMVSIGDTILEAFRPYAHLIKRLKFMCDNTDEFWCRGEGCDELQHFTNVSEIHVVLSENGDFENWHGASDDYIWNCGAENVTFIDEEDGQEMKLLDLEDKYDRLLEAGSRKQGHNTLFRNGRPLN
jgi:hypothetical protein